MIFNNVSGCFDDIPDVTLDRLRRAVAATDADREFLGIWVLGRAIPMVPPQWPVGRIA